jgi:galactose-1-phosphate uridylyltransferase (family 1)
MYLMIRRAISAREISGRTAKRTPNVVDVWAREYQEHGAIPAINHVRIFENKGELMGCSNPHPHGQIWAQHSIPAEPAKEIFRMQEHLRAHHSCLLCDYLALELKEQERIVFGNDDFVAMVPCAFSPSLASFCKHQKIHGGIRNACQSATRYHAGGRR